MFYSEERDEGFEFANESQAAYYTSGVRQAARNVLDIPAGMFAVVCASLAYCEFTDATLRNPDLRLVKVYGSRRVAEYHAAKANAKLADWEECECEYQVFPKLPVPPRAAPTYRDWDEIPF